MTALTFDIRGNLTPYQPIEVTVALFRETFVESFEATSTRHGLWRGFEKFVADFREQISESFQLWVDGSFVTIRRNPKDIDLVILLDADIYLNHQNRLDQHFLSAQGKKSYGVDAYLIKLYPVGEKENVFTRSDTAYWRDWFGRTRRNRAKKRYPKGFIQLNF